MVPRWIFPWYNTAHRHAGLGMLTPHDVHYGLAAQRVATRARVLGAAFAAHPERFVAGPPRPPALPTEVWINKPKPVCTDTERDAQPEVITNFAVHAPDRPAADATLGPRSDELEVAAGVPLNTEVRH